ncbi:Transposon Tn7 transposition protein TnsB [Paraburkholderia ribeironis]|uniref:Transposon Tn7 transposition protein TnsB n=1 Tax=Paraburkholderia ribeironis TaxID=1247936 RepID=A0A1N7SPQ4_9BURK|nr:Mu transposase C-terminal domain-containing protein [Paraburkholderia ribeironis]SIT49358.1 Transposon Tn7 transposition protein TnsB [Paraburkholderia ribeironis]
MLLKNDLFDGKDATRYRVLAIDTDSRRGWVIPLSGPHLWPVYREFGVLTGHADPRAIRKPLGSGVPDIAFHSETARARAREAYDAIQPLISHPQIFDANARGALVEERARETGKSKTTLYRYLRQYWRNGQTVLALIPGFDKIGRTVKGVTAGRGRSPKFGKYTTFQMSEVDVKNIEDAISKHYLDGEISTLAGAYLKMRTERYSYLDGNGESYLLPTGECPSIWQFRQIARTRFKLADVLRKKRGSKEFDREHGPHVGTALEECIGIGHIFEIDATIADVFLVAMEDRASIVGKPTLYLIYDRFSRLVVGFYVGLENASWTGAMLAILSIAADKRALCERYGVPYDPEEWPADGVFPEKFVGDRGEMASSQSYRLCDGMQSTVTNTQSLLPHRKGTVECGFRLFHASIAEVTPGYEPPINATRRRAQRYDKDATLTLDEFTSIVLKHIIAHNYKVMEGYRLQPQHILANTPAVPLELWNDDVRRRSGSLARYDYDFLHLQLMPRETAKVTQDGIKFKRLVYDCPEAHELGWYVSTGKRKKTFDIECSYDPRLADSIIVYNPNDRRQAFVCALASASRPFKGYSFAEVGYVFSLADVNSFEHMHASDQAKANLVKHILSISKPAIAERKAASKGKSRSGRRADTAIARAAELNLRHQNEVSMPILPESGSSNVIPMPPRAPGNSASVPIAPPEYAGQPADEAHAVEQSPADARPAPVTSNPLRDMLRRKAQEKLNGQTSE